MNIDGFI
jgi:ATP-dependent RNA helicase SUPV3L1/SUV3